MRSLISALLLMTAVSGCVVVGGRLRPVSNPAWVEARSYAAPVGKLPRVEIHVFFESKDQPLPGFEVILSAVGHADVREVTDPAGRAVVTLAPGSWKLRGDLPGVLPIEKDMRIETGRANAVDVFTTFRYHEPIM